MWIRNRLKGNQCSNDHNLFIFSDGTPVHATNFSVVLKNAIDKCNLDSELYDTHSLQIGRATDLSKWGTPVDEIK